MQFALVQQRAQAPRFPLNFTLWIENPFLAEPVRILQLIPAGMTAARQLHVQSPRRVHRNATQGGAKPSPTGLRPGTRRFGEIILRLALGIHCQTLPVRFSHRTHGVTGPRCVDSYSSVQWHDTQESLATCLHSMPLKCDLCERSQTTRSGICTKRVWLL